jgi:hypothetical protein
MTCLERYRGKIGITSEADHGGPGLRGRLTILAVDLGSVVLCNEDILCSHRADR